MSDIKLSAESRTEFGKGAARRVRRAHKVPAVIYGHGGQPRHVALPGHETMLALKQANALLTIAVDDEEFLTLVKDVQRDPVKRVIEHVDLVVVRRGEKVEVEVAVQVVGQAAPDTLVTVDAQTLLVSAEATDLPDVLEVSVEDAAPGTLILASQVELPAGTELVSDPETLVVNVSGQASAAALEAELAEAEAAAGIEQDAPQTAEDSEG